jgi:hypothetical protein
MCFAAFHLLDNVAHASSERHSTETRRGCEMALKRNGRGVADRDDPEAIRAAMAKTRAALTEKLQTLQQRVLGPAAATPNQGVQAMAKKRTGTATKSKAAKKGARSGAKAKGGKARKTAASASRKSAGMKAASKSAGKRKAGKSAKKSPAKKSVGSKIVSKLKEAGGDMLAGALAGAVKGAATAAVPHAVDTAQKAEQAAPAQSPSTTSSPSYGGGSGGSSPGMGWPQ